MTESEPLAEAEALIRFQEENPDYWGGQDENGVVSLACAKTETDPCPKG